MTFETLKNRLLKDDPFTSIIGQENIKEQIKTAILTERNVIIVGQPGIGKTTLVKDLARLLEHNKFVRVQGSPDLTAEDLIGDIDPIKALEYGPLSKEAFTPGKLFKADGGILFFDEINRCPEKLQNALLQALQEKKITIGSYDVDFDANFIFIATMNPEDTNTERMSDVLLDRFDLIYMTYPQDVEEELAIVRRYGKYLIKFSDDLLRYYIKFIHDLRKNDQLEKKPSVRATLGLYERGQAEAVVQKQKEVRYQDVQAVLESVLAHRIRLKPSADFLLTPKEFIKRESHKYKENISTSFVTTTFNSASDNENEEGDDP